MESAEPIASPCASSSAGPGEPEEVYRLCQEVVLPALRVLAEALAKAAREDADYELRA